MKIEKMKKMIRRMEIEYVIGKGDVNITIAFSMRQQIFTIVLNDYYVTSLTDGSMMTFIIAIQIKYHRYNVSL